MKGLNMRRTKENLINRPEYIEKLNSWFDQTDLVKIVTGVRRCGKSKLLKLFQEELITQKGISEAQIVDINLENLEQTRKIGLQLRDNNILTPYTVLLDYIISKLSLNKMNYVFIDEVQMLENWQQVANTLRLRDNVDLYLTGSNAYMFSSDLANSFGGRYVEIKMQPYSLKEYREAILSEKENYTPQDLYNNYIIESGFPQTVKFKHDKELISDYVMNTVFYNTIQKDIIRRFNIAHTNKLDAVIRFIFDNIGNETSLRNIEKGLKASGRPVSVPSIDIYLQGLLDSYLVYKCDRFDIKGKQYLDSNAKYYVADIGLRTTVLGSKDMDYGHVLENIVYLELIRRGYRVSVGKLKTDTKTLEVDFVAQKNGNEVEYYQVALYALEPEILERELTPLKKIPDNYPKYLLSMDTGQGLNDGIKRINIFDWLLTS